MLQIEDLPSSQSLLLTREHREVGAVQGRRHVFTIGGAR